MVLKPLPNAWYLVFGNGIGYWYLINTELVFGNGFETCDNIKWFYNICSTLNLNVPPINNDNYIILKISLHCVRIL